MKTLLFFGSIVLCALLSPILIVALIPVAFYGVYTGNSSVFISLDQLLNVILAPLFNKYLKPSILFGAPDETLSSVVGKNIREGDSSFKGIDKVLTALDPHSNSHSVDAIEDDEGVL